MVSVFFPRKSKTVWRLAAIGSCCNSWRVLEILFEGGEVQLFDAVNCLFKQLMAHPHTSLYHMSTSSCFFVWEKRRWWKQSSNYKFHILCCWCCWKWGMWHGKLTFVFPKACGGRISVTELPNEMGIGLEHVEARVEVKNSTRVLWFDFNCFAYSGIHPLEGDSIEFMVRLGEIKFFGSPWITEQKNDENDPRPCENVMVPCTSWTMTCCRAEGCWRVLSWPCERCSHGSLTLTWHLTLWSVSLKLIDVFLKRSSALFS